MIVQDGKRTEVNVEGVSKSQLEELLKKHSEQLIGVLGDAISKNAFHGYSQLGTPNIVQDEKEIQVNSLNKIAEAMIINREQNETNFGKKLQNVKKTKKDVSKTIDILKDIE